MTRKIDPLYSFRLLGQSCVGVLMGVFIALLISRQLWPVGEGQAHVIPEGLLSWELHNIWVKPREKGFYLLVLLLGSMGAYFSTARFYNAKLRPLWIVLIAAIPVTNFFARHMLQNVSNSDAFLPLLLSLGLLISFVLFLAWKTDSLESVTIKESQPNSPFRWKPYLILLSVMAVMLWPASFETVAANIGMEWHVVGYLIGPALYFLGDHLVPGLDYYSQYSVGMGWFFSHIMGHSAESAILNYVRFLLIFTFLFYAQLLYFLHWLYRSWVPASVVTLLSLIFLFLNHVTFFGPSSTELHYPLIGICAWLFARWIERPYVVLRQVILATVLAFSVFFNTETGIISGIAVILSYLLTAQIFRRPSFTLLPLISLAVISAALFLGLVGSIFGPRALQADFFRYLMEPSLVFGKLGFSGRFIRWNMRELNWIYNVIAPGIAIATLALVARSAKNAEANRSRNAVLAFFAISGLMMMAKYVNMSLVAVWQVDALGLLVPLVWWVKVFAQRFDKNKMTLPFMKRPIQGSSLAWRGLIFVALYWAIFSFDSTNPTHYGLRGWIHYQSLVRSFFYKDKKCIQFSCVPEVPAKKDIDLIKNRTQPGEPVAVIDLWDWTYLVSAQRPPLIFYLPSTNIFSKRQLDESLKHMKTIPYIFISKDILKSPNSQGDARGDIFASGFYKNFVPDGEGERLVAWRHKNIPPK